MRRASTDPPRPSPAPPHAATTPRPKRRWARGLALCTALMLGACGAAPPDILELSGATMGTHYSIKLVAGDGPLDPEGLQAEVDARLAEINQQMSTYRSDSDLMRFNLSPSTDWQPVPGPLAELVQRAEAVSAASDGMYDVTVGPLVNLWGFGNSGDRQAPPSEAEVAAVLPLVGHHNLESRREPPALRKQVPGLQVDLSSIAKGWAVDEISALLRRHGVTRSLVEIGGEVYASRDKAPGRPWRVAIERPSYASRAVQHVVALEDRAMATSGDYRNFFPAGGRRYSHTIDPRTGQAMQHGLASVTVIAQNCTDADAWATALMALGEGRARLTAEREGLMALLIVRTDDGFREFVSPRLADSSLWREASPTPN